jgi:O-antigen/teichoic acid export membrane protein
MIDVRLSLRAGIGAVTRLWSTPLRRSATALLLARLVSAVTTLVVLAFLARTRGLDALGVGSLGVVTGTMLAAFTEAGTNSLTTREIARSREEGATLLSAIVVLRAVTLALVVVVSIPLFRVLFGSTGDQMLMFAMAFVIQQQAELARAVLLAVNRPYLFAVHYAVENLVWAAAIVFALAAGADLFVAALAGTIAMTVSVCVGAYLAVVYGVRPGRLTGAACRRAMKLGLPFASYSIVTVAALRLDTVLVGLLVPSGIAAAGAYFAATRLMASAEYIPEAIGRAAYPDLARRLAHAGGEAADVMQPATRDLLLISLPLPIALAIGGSAVLPVVFGPELTPYTWILTVLGFMIPARFLVILFGVALTSANAQGRRAAITGLAVLVGQGLNLLLLPVIGVPAAVMGSILTTCMLLIPYAREVRHRFGTSVRPGDVLVPLACSCLAAVPALACRAVLQSRDAPLGLAATLLVYGVGYLAMTLSLRGTCWPSCSPRR